MKVAAGRVGWRDRKILSEFVLPHLANYLNTLNPEGDDLPGLGGESNHNDVELGHWWELREPIPTRWRLSIRKDVSVELEVNKIEFLLFSKTGIGTLIFESTYPRTVWRTGRTGSITCGCAGCLL